MFRSAIRKSEKFTDAFWNSKSLAGAYNETKNLKESHIAEVFRHGYIELGRLLKVQDNDRDNLKTKSISKSMNWTDNLDRSLRRAMNNESQRLSRAIPFLATTGNTAPFIGLFGTVWGIMDSFHGIAQKGNASLAVVAPGIAEALVATAAGLIAAIPAVVAYNYFVTKLEGMNLDMEAFKDDFLNIIRREMMKSPKNADNRDDS
uniref:Biopolymer transport proteins n=1 Tax=uncultured delta proteobacterium TaxID=34034 RepID=Q2YZT4_9DELT|nr:biopolymer transport proteins [uncultured delta proteobacterium]